MVGQEEKVEKGTAGSCTRQANDRPSTNLQANTPNRTFRRRLWTPPRRRQVSAFFFFSSFVFILFDLCFPGIFLPERHPIPCFLRAYIARRPHLLCKLLQGLVFNTSERDQRAPIGSSDGFSFSRPENEVSTLNSYVQSRKTKH